MRKAVAALLIIAFCTCLIGCHDATEIDDFVHVKAIGIDRGISDKWRLTIQFPTMKNNSSEGSGPMSGGGEGGGEGGGGGGEFEYASIEGPSFFAALNALNATISRTINFMHAQLILVSEELATSGMLGEYLAPISRFREIRRTSRVIVVKGSAFEFIKEVKVTIGISASKAYQLLFAASEKHTGYFPHTTLQNFDDSLKSTYAQPVCPIAAINDFSKFSEEGEPYEGGIKSIGENIAGELVRTSGNKSEFMGAAVFNGDKMVAELNGDETRYLLMVRGEFETGMFSVPDPLMPELIVALLVNADKRPEIKTEFTDDKPKISLKAYLECDILSIQGDTDYEKAELKKQLEESFRGMVEDGIGKVIQKCQVVNTDVFRFGEFAARNFLTIGEWEEYDWNERFKDAEVTVEVEATIRRVGTMIKQNPVTFSDGEQQ